MKLNLQYRIYPHTEQIQKLNEWLRICRYLYNRWLGQCLDWCAESAGRVLWHPFPLGNATAVLSMLAHWFVTSVNWQTILTSLT